MRACGLGMALVLVLSSCATGRLRDGSIDVATTAVPLSTDPATVAVGELRYLGGVVVSSRVRGFGGFSGLRVRDDGWALAVSDTGLWAGFRLVEQGERLVGISSFYLAPILDEQGHGPASKSAVDAESVELGLDGTAVVSMEQDHRFQRYSGIDPARPASFASLPTAVTRPAFMASWPRNGGAETHALVGPETDLTISEDAETAPGIREAVLTIAGEERRFGYRTPPGFAPTDAVGLGDGRALILHRRFSKAEGASAIVAIADFGRTKAGDIVSPREIARFAPPLTVDNMEGIAIRRSGARTFVYLISDDNQNRAQRTLLLKFELIR